MSIRPIEDREKPSVTLIDEDGNAFMIMGRVNTALKEAGWTEDEREEFTNDMMAGTYDDLICLVCATCEVD